MNLFNSRVPYIVAIDGGASQIATKIELFIWNFNETEPTTPTHIIEKETFSTTQYVGKYNISPFVDDKLTNVNRAYFVKVKSYYKLVTAWIAGTETELIATKGYDNATPTFLGYYFLETTTDKKIYLTSDFLINSFLKPTIDVIFDFNTYEKLRVKYINGATEVIVDYEEIGLRFLTIPKIVEDFYTESGNIIEMYSYDGTTYSQFYSSEVVIECEPKYTPYKLDYINSLGGLSQLYLFKKSTISNDYKSTDYNLQGKKKTLNINGTKSVKLNTGWVAESVKVPISEIFLSETLILLSSDLSIGSNVLIKNTNFVEKTSLNDKVINYEFDFESATPLIQNYV
jgi:hypothetical protein